MTIGYPHIDVIVVGAGPTGLLLACELRLAGVEVTILERLRAPATQTKALGFHARTVQTLALRGLIDRFNDGVPLHTMQYAAFPFELVGLTGSHPYSLMIPQTHTERVLAERAEELGVDLRRGHELLDLHQSDGGVRAVVRGLEGIDVMHAQFVVGCDGAHSDARRLAKIQFSGTEPSIIGMVAEIVLPADWTSAGVSSGSASDSLPIGLFRTEHGVFGVGPGSNGAHRVVVMEWSPPTNGPRPAVTPDAMRASLRRVSGYDVQFENASWLTSFTDTARQAERYRCGRILLAGDAAHVHSPIGGQGLNLGLLDSVNLGWKLAAQIHGWAPAGLLDTYHTERHAVAERVIAAVVAQTPLMAPGDHVTALRRLFSNMMDHENNLRYLTALISGTDTHYSTQGIDHPLVGTFMPDLKLQTQTGLMPLTELMHSGRGLLVDFVDDDELRRVAAGWEGRVSTTTANRAPEVSAGALLIRPDGYIAWASNHKNASTDYIETLDKSLQMWFGKPLANPCR